MISNLRHHATAQLSALRTILLPWPWVQHSLNTKRGRAWIWRWSDLCKNIGMFASQTDNNWLAGAGCSDLSPPILTCFYHILNDWKIFARHLESRLHTTFTFRKLHTSEIESKETHQRNAPCCLFSLSWES